MSDFVLAIDQGTTGTTTILVDESGAIVRRAYREIPASPPRHAITWSNLAALGIALGDIAGAGRHAQQAVRLQPSSAEANNNLGVAFWRTR